MKTDLFQSCVHCWVFQICCQIECSTFTVSSFRIRNSSTGIPSSPLALFIVMLPKAHLTSHSRMSGSKRVITPSWLSGSWRSFLYSSSMYSCHLFLIFSAYITISVPYWAHLCMKCSLGISNFLEDISSLSHSIIFLYLDRDNQMRHLSFPNILNVRICMCLCSCMLTQSCPTLCDSMDCSPSGLSVHGVSKARILQQVATSYFRGSSWPRDQTCISCVSCTGKQILYHCTSEAIVRICINNVIWFLSVT